MASINLTGILRGPTGEFANLNKIRFTHTTTTGQTLKGFRSVYAIGDDGSYDIDVEYGNVFIESQDALNRNWIDQGTLTINSDTPATDLPSLLGITTPTTDADLLVFQALVADAELARDESIAAASSIGISSAARVVGVENDEIIYTSDTATTMSGILYLYDEDIAVTYIKPGDVSNSDTVVSVVDGLMTTSSGSTYKMAQVNTKKLDHTDEIKRLIGACYNGELTLKIACYGDSTTDGDNTTDWVANVLGTDHAPDAPNAWPQRLLENLELMGLDVEVWNAGFSGKSLVGSWANTNYDEAVINNTNYGTPDIVFVGFALNDIAQNTQNVTQYMKEARRLLTKIIAYGGNPVLTTSDPIIRNDPTARDNTEVRRTIDTAKQTLANEFNIPLLDFGAELQHWIQNNNSGLRWTTEQSDSLHFSDNGHAFKGGFSAAWLMGNVVWHDSGKQEITSFASENKTAGSWANLFTASNNKQGGNFYTSLSALTDSMDVWIFNRNPDAYLSYNSIDHDGVNSETPNNITVNDRVLFTETSKDLQTYALSAPVLFRVSDSVLIHSKLPLGLSRVTYQQVNSGQQYTGGLIVSELTKQIGQMSKFEAVGTGEFIDVYDDTQRSTNIIGSVDSDISIKCSANIQRNGGVILMYGQGQSRSDQLLADNPKNFTMLFRGYNTNNLQLYRVRYDDTGFVDFDLIASVSHTWDTDNSIEFEYVMGRDGLNQTHVIYDGFVRDSELINETVEDEEPTRWGGYFGGIYLNTANADCGTNINWMKAEVL